MTASKARIKANSKYNAKTYDEIKVRLRKDTRMFLLIEYACQQTKKSKTQYIIDAIQAQLNKDGITIDMLPSEDQGTIEE